MIAYQIHRALIPFELCLAVRRRLLLELRRCGVKPEEILEWASGSWWPSLRFEPEILDVCRELERALVTVDDSMAWAEPQILIRLPDEDDVRLGEPHTDTLDGSPWLGEWRYRRIYGVECTDTPPHGGRTHIYPNGLDGSSFQPTLATGDVMEMHPWVLHSGSPNHSADIRIALFFRLLERA